MSGARRISLAQQIEAVTRELQDGAPKGMRASEADYHRERLEAALRTLQWCDRHQDIIVRVAADEQAEKELAAKQGGAS